MPHTHPLAELGTHNQATMKFILFRNLPGHPGLPGHSLRIIMNINLALPGRSVDVFAFAWTHVQAVHAVTLFCPG